MLKNSKEIILNLFTGIILMLVALMIFIFAQIYPITALVIVLLLLTYAIGYAIRR